MAVSFWCRSTWPASPWAAQSSRLNLAKLGATPQWMIDQILWKSVYGADSN